MRRVGGFSLIELSAVLLIAAVAAGAVAIRIGGPSARMDYEQVLDQIQRFDELARDYARQHDQELVLVIELDRGRLYKQEPEDAVALGTVLELPSSVRLRQAWTGGAMTASGAVRIPISRHGLGGSYALQVAGNKQDGWLMIAGLTGQVSRLANESDIEHAAKALQTAAGPDAG